MADAIMHDKGTRYNSSNLLCFLEGGPHPCSSQQSDLGAADSLCITHPEHSDASGLLSTAANCMVQASRSGTQAGSDSSGLVAGSSHQAAACVGKTERPYAAGCWTCAGTQTWDQCKLPPGWCPLPSWLAVYLV